MTENEVAKQIVDAAYKIHSELGPGLLESVYETLMEHELIKRNLTVQRQREIPFVWDGIKFDNGFRADLIVEEKVIVELKSVEKSSPVHGKQLLTYLKLSNRKLGLLLNFGMPTIKEGIKRIANGLYFLVFFASSRLCVSNY